MSKGATASTPQAPTINQADAMTRIYFVYSRSRGTPCRKATCECDTLDPSTAQRIAMDCRRRGLVAEIKAMDVPTEELA